MFARFLARAPARKAARLSPLLRSARLSTSSASAPLTAKKPQPHGKQNGGNKNDGHSTGNGSGSSSNHKNSGGSGHGKHGASRQWLWMTAAMPGAAAALTTLLAPSTASGEAGPSAGSGSGTANVTSAADIAHLESVTGAGTRGAVFRDVPNNPDRTTGILFEPAFTLPTHARQPLSLVAVGARCVKGMCWYPGARVYAAALYVDPAQAQAATNSENIGRFAPVVPLTYGADGEDKESAQRMAQLEERAPFEALFLSDPADVSTSQPPLARAVVLRFNRDVNSLHVANGFRSSLLKRQSRLKQLTRDDVQHFADVFTTQSANIRAGSELVIAFGTKPDPTDHATGAGAAVERVRVWYDGQAVLRSRDLSDGGRALAWALADMYFGTADPIAWDITDHFSAGFRKAFPPATPKHGNIQIKPKH